MVDDIMTGSFTIRQSKTMCVRSCDAGKKGSHCALSYESVRSLQQNSRISDIAGRGGFRLKSGKQMANTLLLRVAEIYVSA